jgi:hypothetical protein
MTTEERQMRTFSEAFKKEKVKEIEEKKLTVLEVSGYTRTTQGVQMDPSMRLTEESEW